MPEDRLLQPEEAQDLADWFALGEPSEREMWKAMYGFDHDCRCEQDVEEDNMESVPVCFLNMQDDAMASLRRMRSVLFTIARADTEDATTLKRFASSMLGLGVDLTGHS